MTTAEMVAAAFRRIENRLIESMMRNLGRHKAEEAKEGLNWEQWQAIQLQELERYKKEHGSLFDADFEEINKKVEEALRQSYNDAETSKEASLLQRILDKVFPTRSHNQGMEGQFFGIDQAQLNAMIDAVENDFTDAEKALLRRANDIYRQTIFDAQIMATAGMTYEEAVDMAVKDFLKKGIDCIEYKNGSRHSIEEYASMAIRTAQKRAYLMGLGKELDKAGIHTVRVNKRTEACPYCVGWLGRVLVDDVYSGGTPLEASEAGVPLLSQAMNMGFLHPNCKDVYSIYIPGVSRPAEPWTKEEIQEIAEQYNADQEKRHAENMAESYERMAKYSLDPTNRERYEVRAKEWEYRAEAIKRKDTISVGGVGGVGTEKIECVGEIDYSDTDAVMDRLAQEERRLQGLDHEEAIIVTADGNVWHGETDGVTIPLGEITSSMDGAYMYHNHPDGETNHSFGEEDIATFISKKIKYSKASDSLYEYEMWRTDATLDAEFDIVYSEHKRMQNIEGLQAVLDKKLDVDVDKFDEIAKILSEKYGFEYRRKEIIK